MKFQPRRPAFGRPQPADAPAPARRLAGRKRFAQLAEAGAIADNLPAEGEAVHALMTGRYDLMHALRRVLQRLGPSRLVIATLSYNGRNLAEMTDALDAGEATGLTLLCSAFFRDHNKELWEETQEAFAERNQRCAAARSHAKVVLLDAPCGKLVMEGSANLRTNGNREQLAVYRSAELHDWHAAWINELVDKHHGEHAE